MPRRPLTIHQVLTQSKEWLAWKQVNDYPLSPFKDDINDAELTGFFTPKHWRAFARFLEQAAAHKHKKLKININKYYDEKKQ
jgi:hypothetical protein